MDEVYEIVAASAGSQAVVALAGIPAHARHYELPSYAAAMVRDGETSPAAIYRHLTESADMAKLVAGLSEVTAALIARLGPDDNPDWYRQHYGLVPAS